MKGSHLTLDDRKKIQEGIEQALTKFKLEKTLEKTQLLLARKLNLEEN